MASSSTCAPRSPNLGGSQSSGEGEAKILPLEAESSNRSTLAAAEAEPREALEKRVARAEEGAAKISPVEPLSPEPEPTGEEDAVRPSWLREKAQPSATKLVRAATEGNSEQVFKILEMGVNAASTARGTTPLHESSKGGHLEIVSELVKRTADVNGLNRSGCTPLHFAALCKDKARSLDVVKLLLDLHAAVNVSNERMDTPLHFACYCPSMARSEEVVGILLFKRALVNARNRSLESPLINAAVNDNPEVVKALLDGHAEANQKNAADKCALDLAKERGCSRAVEVLRTANPMFQLNEVAQQMRISLEMMNTCQDLNASLQQESLLKEAYAGAAMTAAAALGRASCARVAAQALEVLHECEAEQPATQTLEDLVGCSSSALPQRQRLLQAIVSLLTIARVPQGNATLQEMNVAEVLPQLARRADAMKMGGKEVCELKVLLSKFQASQAAEKDDDRHGLSTCSTPSSLVYAGLDPTTGRPIYEWSSSTTFDGAGSASIRSKSTTPQSWEGEGFPRKSLSRPQPRMPVSAVAVSAPCIISRQHLPQFPKVDEGSNSIDDVDAEDQGEEANAVTWPSLGTSMPGRPQTNYPQANSRRSVCEEMRPSAVVPSEGFAASLDVELVRSPGLSGSGITGPRKCRYACTVS